MCGEQEGGRGRHGRYELEVARSVRSDVTNAIVGAIFNLLHYIYLTIPCNQLTSNQMGREELEGLHVSPKPAASRQQENQQTAHFPSHKD